MLKVANFALPFGLLLTALACSTGERATPEHSPPNIIVIHIDDLGWADLSVQGSTYFETPNIDGLAASGIRFTDAYAAASVCSPTRAALMTGKSPARLGITDWIRARFQGGEVPDDGRNPEGYEADPEMPLMTPVNPLWLELEEVTIGEWLGRAGYKTGHIGKWHLGGEGWLPEDQGFDINIGGTDLGEPPTFFDPYRTDRIGGIATLEPRNAGEYLTDREADEAVRLIEAWRDRPFFLHFSSYAVHTPIEAKEELIERYRNKPPSPTHDHPVYAAMIHSVDEAVGRILNALKEHDLL